MTEDQLSLINIRRFATPNEPNCLMCCFFNPNENNVHLKQHCQRLLQAHQCFKCLGQHSWVDYPNLIPLSLDNCPTCHLLHNGQALGNIPLHEGKYDIKCGVSFEANVTEFSFGPCGMSIVHIWRRSCLHLKTFRTIKNLPNGWLPRLWGTPSTTLHGWQMHAYALLKKIIMTYKFVQDSSKVNGNLGSASFTQEFVPF